MTTVGNIPGRKWDSESSLYNFKARYVDPDFEHFMTIDPLLTDLSPYNYGSGNPTNLVDYTGLAFNPRYVYTGEGVWYDTEKDEYHMIGPSIFVSPNSFFYEYVNRTWWGFDASNNPYHIPYYTPYYGSGGGTYRGGSGGRNTYNRSKNLLDIFTGPLATKKDPKWYQFLRGTGDIIQDGTSFCLGVPSIVAGAAVLTLGAAVTTPAIVAEIELFMVSGIVLSEGITAGYSIASVETSFIANSALYYSTVAANRAMGYYLTNKPVLDHMAIQFSKGLGAQLPGYPQNSYGMAAYGAGRSINYLFSR